ncbi:MAG: tRNA (guanine(10)-N(2))-dimethyltransferase [Candidatus Bathyarchaeia archaeon]
MGFDFATRAIEEGSARLFVPEIGNTSTAHLDHLLSRAPVFYNPRMKLNRDIAVLALQVYQRRHGRGFSVCEPMCGTGVRGIRLAKEVEGVERVVMGDLNPLAVRLASFNIGLNGLRERVVVRNLDANLLLALHSGPGGRFDYVDVDPFGSPVYYLDSAVRALRSGGLLAVTATDMAPLCGVHPEACLRKYGGSPLHSEYCHEVALRLLIGSLASTAARHEKAVRVVFSHSTDHYVRAYAVLEQGSEAASRSLREMGYILHCPRCLNRRTVYGVGEIGEGKCDECGETMIIAGPLWLGPLSDASLCGEMIEEAERRELGGRRLMRLLSRIHSESEYPPTFFNIDKISGPLSLPSPPTGGVLRALREVGYRATRTHFHPRGVKTDAPLGAIREILLALGSESQGAGSR